MVKIEISSVMSSDYISKKDYEENEEQLREQFVADCYSVGINMDFRYELFNRLIKGLNNL